MRLVKAAASFLKPPALLSPHFSVQVQIINEQGFYADPKIMEVTLTNKKIMRVGEGAKTEFYL